MEKKINVLIVGAGKIGAFFDAPGSSAILTHAHAFKSMQNFNLLGFVDSDKQSAEKAAHLWGAKAYGSLAGAFASSSIDVVSVAVPDEYHFEVLKHLTHYPVKIVFAEKPLTKKLSEVQEIITLYSNYNISLLVNYTRRFVPEFRLINERIRKGEFGNYVSGTGYYGKGVVHNGSHLVDFLQYLLGSVKSYQGISFSRDFYHDDPSVSAVLFFEQEKPFFLQAIDCRLYTIFEIDLLFSKARVRITDSGFYIQEQKIKKSTLFSGYFNLCEEASQKTSLDQAMFFAAQNIYRHITDGEDLWCTAQDAYAAQMVCQELINTRNLL